MMWVAAAAFVLLPPQAQGHDFADGAPRYWPKFAGSREVRVLDGIWEYGLLDLQDGGSFDSMCPDFGPQHAKTPHRTAVPSTMDLVAGGAPGYLGPRGIAMYRTQFATPRPGLPVRLQFQSCGFYCRVWVNGKEVGDHRAGGYVAFWLDVPAKLLSGSQNELFVLADNRFNSTTAPMHTGGDFWHYGGLTRSVELHAMAAEPVLWRAYVLPSDADVTRQHGADQGTPSSVDITLQFSCDHMHGPVNVTLAFDDWKGPPVSHTAVARDGSAVLRGVAVPNPTAWSPEQPDLHTVVVTYEGGAVIERFGLRRFGVQQGRITINGKVTKLVGWNYHTQHPVTAASPTEAQIDTDIALLKKGNANYVRGSHYPHDPRVLDRLDEAGLLFWSETLGPKVSLENLTDFEVFMPFQMQQLQEMLDNAMNHASVLAWGWFNEAKSEPTACPAYAACSKYSRSRDPSRFVTWADNKCENGACYEHATLVAFNSYPGWYHQPGDPTAPGRMWPRMAQAVRDGSTASGNGTLGKPFVISETGAGGIFEWDANETDERWTLRYMNAIVAADVDEALGNDQISGISLWHFYDFKADERNGQENNTHCTYDHPPPETFAELEAKGPPNCTWIATFRVGRPGGANHKGAVDFWRREKPIFGIVAGKYGQANAIGTAGIIQV